MSWRAHADLAQEVILDTMTERDADGALSVVFQPAGGVARPIRAILHTPHEEVQPDPLTAPVSQRIVRIGVKFAELAPDWPLAAGARFLLPARPGRDPLVSEQTRCEVYDQREDGQGMVELYLRPRA